MQWKTLYVTGRTGFENDLVDSLDKSGEHFLTGSFNAEGTYLFWVTEKFVLRNLKSALGSKTIFRYRLRFFSEIGAFAEFRDKNMRNHRFTPDQEQMFRDMDS